MSPPDSDDVFLTPTDPATQRQLAAAILSLRLELLAHATEYGLALLLGTGTPAGVPAWREWIAWAMAQLEDGDGSVEKLDTVPSLDEFERSGERDESALSGFAPLARWTELIERLAVRARALEELGTIPLGEEEGHEFGAGVALLGTLEDALALELTDDGEGRPTAAELLDLLKAAREEGVWDFLAAA